MNYSEAVIRRAKFNDQDSISQHDSNLEFLEPAVYVPKESEYWRLLDFFLRYNYMRSGPWKIKNQILLNGQWTFTVKLSANQHSTDTSEVTTVQTTELRILKKSIYSSTHQDSNAGHQMQIYITLMV